jgi:hypothetical protein
VGRFVGAGITLLVGAGVRPFQTIGIPVELRAVAFAAGLLLIPFGEETQGRSLPCLGRFRPPGGEIHPLQSEGPSSTIDKLVVSSSRENSNERWKSPLISRIETETNSKFYFDEAEQ